VNKKLVALVIICIIVVSFVAYNESVVSQELSGTIRISGAFALYPLMVVWAQQYEKLHPKVTIEVSAGGAGKGMTDALAGLVDIGMISRQISPTEIANGAFYVAVAEGAGVATISASNPVLSDVLTQGFTKQVFYDIFVAGNVTSWGQALGLPDAVQYPIHVYTRSDAAGVADTWAKFLGAKSQEDLKGIGVYADPGIIEALQGDPLGIGYNNVAYAYDNSTGQQVSGISVVPIDLNGNGKIDAQENFYSTDAALIQAIEQGKYPSPPAQDLYLVTKNKFTGVTKDFVTWILTDGQSFVKEAGLVPLSTDTISSQLAKVQS
jgi:phosphate transport system substrate-binding protein